MYKQGTRLLRVLKECPDNAETIVVQSVRACEANPEGAHTTTCCPQCLETWSWDYDLIELPETPREVFNEIIRSAVEGSDLETARDALTQLRTLDGEQS